MRAIEFYAMEQFFKIQDQFPASAHRSVFEQLLTVYCPWNFPLLSDDQRSVYYNRESASNAAAEVGEILVPILIDDKVELMVVNATIDDVINERKARLERANSKRTCSSPENPGTPPKDQRNDANQDLLETATRAAKLSFVENAVITQEKSNEERES